MSRRKIAFVILSFMAVLSNLIICLYMPETTIENVKLSMAVLSKQAGDYKIYYSDTKEFREQDTSWMDYKGEEKEQELSFYFPENSRYIRIDFPEKEEQVQIKGLHFQYQKMKWEMDENYFMRAELNRLTLDHGKEGYQINTEAEDPHLLLELSGSGLWEKLENYKNFVTWIRKIGFCFWIDLIILFLLYKSKRISELYYELYENKKLIWKLAKNDFKMKYAGSYLGIIWAFIQPIVTILVYWFVFQIGLRNGDVGEIPFALWFTAGLIPWFFFSDSLNGATNAMIEYSYLVKKVVFHISVLPVIKMLSALFVHVFFVGFLLVIFAFNGYIRDLYSIQILYYTACMFVLVLGISYTTSAIVVFFKDLTQIINIILQIGVWMTPIMWNIEMIPEGFRFLFRINPMYYVVQGYRDALFYQKWFFEDIGYTLYFWIVTGMVFSIGIYIFRKLRRHFADLL